MSTSRLNPLRQLAIAFGVLTVAFFAIASATHTAKHGAAALAADISWFGLQLSLLALVVVGVVAVVRALRARRQAVAR
jgi:heme/copper-type cytochrome/quinol oxidase subunit 2